MKNSIILSLIIIAWFAPVSCGNREQKWTPKEIEESIVKSEAFEKDLGEDYARTSIFTRKDEIFIISRIGVGQFDIESESVDYIYTPRGEYFYGKSLYDRSRFIGYLSDDIGITVEKVGLDGRCQVLHDLPRNQYKNQELYEDKEKESLSVVVDCSDCHPINKILHSVAVRCIDISTKDGSVIDDVYSIIGMWNNNCVSSRLERNNRPSMQEYFNCFRENPLAFEEKYSGELAVISGKLRDVSRAGESQYSLCIDDIDSKQETIMAFTNDRDKVLTLKTGQIISVIGFLHTDQEMVGIGLEGDTLYLTDSFILDSADEFWDSIFN